MLETELKKIAPALPALTEAVTVLTARVEALTEALGGVIIVDDDSGEIINKAVGEDLNKDEEPPKADKPTATKGKGKAAKEPPQEDDDDDFLDDDDDDVITADTVKALAKKAVGAGVNRTTIKKAMVKAGANRFKDLSEDALVKMDKWLRSKL